MRRVGSSRVLCGELDGEAITAELVLRPTAFPLLTRGFHWVSDRRYNR